jgi:threonine synthase
VEADQYANWIEPVFRAARSDDADTLATMASVYRESGMLIDPRTAVGVSAARRQREAGVPVVTMATAHPAKFPDAVKKATGVHPALPEHLSDLLERPERTTPLPNELAGVQAFVRSVARS